MAKYSGKLAQRYARAFLRAVESELGTEGSPTPAQTVAAALLQFARVWKHERELSSTILNPMFSKEEREKALLAVAARAELPDVAIRFLRVMYSYDRIAALPEIAQAFALLADEAAGMVRVEVTVARDVSHDESRAIQSDLSHRIPGKPQFTWRVDPGILGGMIVRYGGKVLDGSLSGQLERLERRLLG